MIPASDGMQIHWFNLPCYSLNIYCYVYSQWVYLYYYSSVDLLTFVVQWCSVAVQWCQYLRLLFSGASTYVCCTVVFSGCSVVPVLHLLVSGISGCSVVPVLTFVVQWHQYLHLLLSGVQWLFIGASTCVCWSALFSGTTYLRLLLSGVQWLFSGASFRFVVQWCSVAVQWCQYLRLLLSCSRVSWSFSPQSP